MSTYLSPGAASKVLGVSTQCLVDWVEQGRLSAPVLTEGGHRRYHRGEVLRLAEGMHWRSLADDQRGFLVMARDQLRQQMATSELVINGIQGLLDGQREAAS